jgi:hypothetical integral membrane protein (TIGR02206 family)
MYFQHFSVTHVSIIVLVPFCAAVITVWARRQPHVGQRIRFILAALIGVNELVWYGYVQFKGWIHFPYGLPLDLCDLVLWLTVFTLFTSKSWSFDLIYYWGLIGTGMAVLTPDIGAHFPSYIALKFLFAHGGVVTSILFLLWSGNGRPRKNSWWKALLWLNLYFILISSFNLLFQTNYFYLCQKPLNGSLLDYLGDWPWYLLSGEILAVILFYILWLPFRMNRDMNEVST